jgi:hypothetical protein
MAFVDDARGLGDVWTKKVVVTFVLFTALIGYAAGPSC